MRSDVLALLYLQSRIARNWLRRSARSVVAWVLIVAFAAMTFSGLIFGDSADTPADDGAQPLPSVFLEASGVLLFLTTVAIAVWRGTGPPPRATAADIVFVLGSPIRARVQFAYLMFRDVAALLSILSLVALLSVVGGLLQAVAGSGATLEGAFSSPTLGIWLIILVGGVTRMAVWVATEQAVVRDARRGHRLRRALRGAMVLGIADGVAFVALPVFDAGHDGLRDMAQHAAERLMLLAAVPPLSFPPLLYGDGGSPLAGLGALLLTALAIAAAGLAFAHDFAEPIAVMAERQTDARGQSIESGNDLQWSTMSQIGAAPRLRITIPPFGRGPWALFWSSLVRWARYQMSVALAGLLMLVGMSLIVTVLARLNVISSFWIWGLALSMPVFSSYNMFLDELRKPFLFMIPGSPWKRLIASGATSVIDGVIASMILALIATVAGALSPKEALLLVLAATSVGFLIQATVGLVQVVLPSWLNRKIRTSLTFGANALALLPVATAFIVGLAMSGTLAGYAAAVVTTLLTSVIVLTLSVLLFDRLEMPV